jgi:hypothetical protein
MNKPGIILAFQDQLTVGYWMLIEMNIGDRLSQVKNSSQELNDRRLSTRTRFLKGEIHNMFGIDCEQQKLFCIVVIS